jgi:hypothetical protein
MAAWIIREAADVCRTRSEEAKVYFLNRAEMLG